MSREEFLSSNLFSMRDRLRRNTERIRAEKNQRESDNTPESQLEASPVLCESPEPQPQLVVNTPSAHSPSAAAPCPAEADTSDDDVPAISMLPSISIPHEGTAAGRERREFEGILLRDCAFADELLSRSRRDMLALQEFRKNLYRQLQAVRQLDEEGRALSEKDYSRQLARLRGEYLYGSGKFDAVLKKGEKVNPAAAPAAARAAVPGKMVFYLILGLICNALIIAAGFFCAWKRWW